MTFLEKNLEDIIYQTPNEKLRERGLWIYGNKKRQVRIGNYGVADLVTYNRFQNPPWEKYIYPSELTIVVYELKQHKIDATTLMQAVRYCKGIQRYIESHRKKDDLIINYKSVLIGRGVCSGDFVYLSDFIENLHVCTYEYEFDGIKFEGHSRYKLTNEGFGE